MAQNPLHVTSHGLWWVTVGRAGQQKRKEPTTQGQVLETPGLCPHKMLSVLWMLLPDS